MKKLLISLLLLLPAAPAHAAFTVLSHVDTVQMKLGYHLPTEIKTGRIETKVRKNHTNQTSGDFYKLPFDRNMFVLRHKYLNSWLCASGEDTSKCVSTWQGL